MKEQLSTIQLIKLNEIAQSVFGEEGKVKTEIDFRIQDDYFYVIIETNFYTLINPMRINGFVEQVKAMDYFSMPYAPGNYYISATPDKNIQIFFDVK